MMLESDSVAQIADSDIMAAAHEYVAAGFALVPIDTGSKGPKTAGWNRRENCITSADQCLNIKGNIGLAHAYSGTCTLDFDDFAEATTWLSGHGIEMTELWDADNAVRVSSGRINRGKLLFRLPDGVAPLRRHNLQEHGIELRCASKKGLTVQDVLPPSIHPDTGRPYCWEYANPEVGSWRNPPVLPDAVLKVWQSLDVPAAAAIRDTKPLGIDNPNLVAALKNLNPDMGYDKWLKVGMGLHYETNGEGFDLWNTWSAASDIYPGAETLQVHWDSFGNNSDRRSVTIGSLLKFAAESGNPVTIDCTADFEILSALPKSASLYGYLSRAASSPEDVRNGTDTTYPLTDQGNAGRLFDMYGDSLRYVSDVQKWLTWDSSMWVWDGDGAKVRVLATNLAKKIYEEGSQYFLEGKHFAAHSRHSQTVKAIKDAVSFLADRPQIRVNIQQVDSNKMLVGFGQARRVIDLNTGTQRAA